MQPNYSGNPLRPLEISPWGNDAKSIEYPVGIISKSIGSAFKIQCEPIQNPSGIRSKSSGIPFKIHGKLVWTAPGHFPLETLRSSFQTQWKIGLESSWSFSLWKP